MKNTMKDIMTNPILDPSQCFVSLQLVEGSFLVGFLVVDLNMRGFGNQRVEEVEY